MADAILALDLPGVAATREYRRYYPLAETAGHVVGMTNIDGAGIEGVEKARNDYLAGKNGQTRVVRDAKGKLVESVVSIEEMQPGQDVQLSIDRRIQYLAYKELKTQVTQLNAKAGSLVVMDAHSGEILAMANVPSFNPNNRKDIEPYVYRNRAVTDKSEPGSTLKPLTIAAALEARVIGPDVEINTSPGHINFGKYSVKDPKDYGSISLPTLLAKSSNVGASRVALLMNARDQWMFLSRVGFGRVPDAGFAGETAGQLTNYTQWGKVDRASHGYGYGLSSSLLQITHAYAPFAANGVFMPASIYKLDKPGVGQQVMSPDTVRAVLHMMEAVVQAGGTGEKAMVDGYRVAGKTGTAYKFIDGQYRNDRYLTSFIGVAPASHPRLVVAVQIDEPKIDDSGGRAAAPVFSKVMAESLRLLDVPPDNLPGIKQAGQKPAPVQPRTATSAATLSTINRRRGNMKNALSLRVLLAGIVESAPDVRVTGLTLDNRHIQPGMAFVALRGTRQHGLSYAEAAVRAGAVVVLYEPEDGLQQPPLSVEAVPVPSLRSIWARSPTVLMLAPVPGCSWWA